jgi:hypothetical protein
MNTRFNKFLTISSFLILTSLLTYSCKKQFDEPPVENYPVLATNASISRIKALHTIGNTATEITDSLVVEAIVVSSDEAGNFYKQLIVQDDSAGIEIRVEMGNLYTDYPVGRKVYLKCKGLFVGDYQGNHQLTLNSAGDRIPENLLPDFVIGGAKDQNVIPKVVSILDLKNSTQYRNMLVELNSVQFAAADTNQTYADAAGQASLNRSLNDCNGNTVLLRSSGYATFASELTKGGNGTAIGVHSNFGTDAQLYIRDPSDLTLNAARCTTSIGGNLISISSLRTAFGGTIPSNSKINGYVISDRNTLNLVSQNMVVMDATAGITVRFTTTTHSFNEGDQVEISLTGGSLTDYNGLMQLEGIATSSVSVISSGNSVPPTTVTVADLNANPENYESELIKIVNASISGSSTYSGTTFINDGTGAIDLFSRFGSTFAGNSVPCGTLEITGIMGQFTTYQVQLRNPASDVVGGTPCGSGAILANISDVRALYTGTAVTLNSQKIRGIVISDRANANLVTQNIVVQDSLGFGITVRFSANHSLNLGDKVEINVSGGTLDVFNGLLQISNLATSTATVVSSGNTVAPRIATIADILTNAETWESTLVQILTCTISGTTYGTGNTITDVTTQNITLYTRTGATFSGTAVPSGSRNVTGILSQFDTSLPHTSSYQILMRNLSDVN